MANTTSNKQNKKRTPENPREVHKLNIIAINVNSLINLGKRVDLELFITKHITDIALVSETKFKQIHKLKISGYDIIRNDRSKRQNGGGTAIIIRKEIEYEIIHLQQCKSKR